MFAGIPFNRAPDGMVVSPGFLDRPKKRKNEKLGTIPPEFILRVSNRGEKPREAPPQHHSPSQAAWRCAVGHGT